MQTLRASAIALPFIGLAVLIGVLSILLASSLTRWYHPLGATEPVRMRPLFH